MRWTASAGLLVLALFVLGCGDSGAPPATASAGAPPSAGGPPGGPPAPGGDAPPAETPPAGENPPPGETPPPSESPPPGGGGEGSPAPEPPPAGSPDQAPLPGGEGGGSGGSFEGGGQPGDPNNPNPENTPRRPPPPRTLRDQAYAEFRAGRDVMGYKLLNAHFAVVPAAKKELAQKMAWMPGIMRPGVAPRIGIGVFYEQIPLQFRGNPMPIGSPELTTIVDSLQQATASDKQVGGGRRAAKDTNRNKDFSERAKGDPNDSLPAATQLNYYLGDFGHMFLDALLDRMDAGDYGPVMKELMQQSSRPIKRGSGIGPDGQPLAGEPPPGGEFGGPPGGDSGGPGDPAGGGPGGGRRGPGNVSALSGSSGLPGAGDESDTGKRRFASREAEKESELLSSVKQLNPCIIWLGKTEERDDLVKRAQATGCDIMAVFHITLREARASSLINNTTVLKIQNLRAGKPLAGYSAEPLINLTVETWRQKEEKGIDPVEKEVTKAIEALDKALKPVPLPEAVTADRAKKRVADLVAQKPEDALPVIVEARFYSAKGLMTEEEYVETAKSLLGDSGFEKLKARAKEGEK